ncbi:hypothetical protein ASG60_18335 [Methylobacterium sp. Leaf469]|uniref:sigma-70 family RNA polymerase sigma factor n=1 Tax=Methylobacterium sp. Leaf469 TaxID=1736387 RepID=UPI0006F3D0EA|nr:sigma-70 family RNA polymerase sigma factor [Methylobacterium sp. Leaf469]KQU01811.1 hypothetical protein ASG60_18335 [Methylobacterium sp. Leaf469]
MSIVLLLDEGAVRQMNPLFKMAVVNGVRSVVEASIRKNIDLDARDQRGVTVLMLAAARGHSTICRLLLEAGADPDIRDRDGRNAAEHATLGKHTAAYLMIAEAKARQLSQSPAPPDVGTPYLLLENHDPSGSPAPNRVVVQGAHSLAYKADPEPEDDRIPWAPTPWEADAEPARPEQDVGALRSATTDSLRISLHRPRTEGQDWSGISLSLPPAPSRARDAHDAELEPLLRRRLGGILLQGMRSGVVHPSRISAAVGAHPAPAILAAALTTTLSDMGVGVDCDYPDLWSPISSLTPHERQRVNQALASIALQVAEGPDEIARLRDELERWSLLSRADEVIYGRQIREGLQGALSIAARTTTLLTRIMLDCGDAIEGHLPAGDLLDLDEDDPWDRDDDADVADAEASGDDSDLPEHLRTLSVRMRALRLAFAEMQGTGGPGSDPILARSTARLLDECGFSTSFLRTLSELEPADRHDARLMEEYRAALGRMDHARECMILSNMKLVIWQAKKYKPASMTLADLVQEGSVGLMKAVSRFDPFRGFRFATYALWWIRQSMTRAIADKDRLIRLPVHALEHHRRIQWRLNRGESFGSLTGAGVAADLSISPQVARGMLDVFFDAECAGGMDEMAGVVPLVGDSDPLQHLEAKELRREVGLLLGELEPRHRDILNRRFGLIDDIDQTLEEVGQLYGVTRERIRQIEAKALAKLTYRARERRLLMFLR